MRVLFLHQFPLDASPPSRLIEEYAAALAQAGHEVRAVVVDGAPRSHGPLAVRSVVCSPTDSKADLPFGVPRFGATSGAEQGALTFRELTDSQLVAYREALRRHLDVEVDQFDPHVIHVQHIWVAGQLALETGVPYVIHGWEAELIDRAHDARYRGWADQAAENAARILVHDEPLRQQVTAAFDLPSERVLVMPSGQENPTLLASELSTIYQQALDERFGG